MVLKNKNKYKVSWIPGYNNKKIQCKFERVNSKN